MEEYVSDRSEVPEDMIKEVTGNVAFDERYPRVYPLTNFPDFAISEASKNLINKHLTAFPMERILEQV